ncbi:hypothetical protein LBMAG42_15790 [Deltaproteobacteria bacterium]|nr:hypothetical protein LBMAG42_15790 [Deltaproteobacteria bacterium]
MTMLPLLFGFTGCGEEAALGKDAADTAPLPCDERPASVAIGGSGTDELQRPIWTEMPEGSEQTMVHGPQGGWHILASADVQSTDDIVTIEYTITWPARADAQLSYGSFRVMLVPDARCGGYYAGMLGILDVSDLASGEADTPPELLAGETLSLTMNVIDLNGLTASDAVNIVAALDPDDVPVE